VRVRSEETKTLCDSETVFVQKGSKSKKRKGAQANKTPRDKVERWKSWYALASLLMEFLIERGIITIISNRKKEGEPTKARSEEDMLDEREEDSDRRKGEAW